MVACPLHRSQGPLRWVLLVLAMIAVAGCSGDTDPVVGPVGPVGPIDQDGDAVEGSGEIVAEQREIDAVTGVVLEGEGNVVVVVGSGPSLTVETDANLLQYIESDVDGDTLRLRTVGTDDIEPTESVAYRIELPQLSALDLAGAGSITIEEWSTPTADVSLTGTGDVVVGGLVAEDLVVERIGVGTVRIAGSTGHQDVTADGVGEYDAAELASSTARVVAGGTVDVIVLVSDSLEAEASGTATVTYAGPMSAEIRTDGLATVTWLGEGS